MDNEQIQIRTLLHDLGFSSRHIGYKALCIAIPNYAQDNTQRVTKELYPGLRKQFGYESPTAIERPIRYAIAEAWHNGDPRLWQQYFPQSAKAPSNSVFIAAIAEQLK